MMQSNDCLTALARHIGDGDIVLPVYSTAFDWLAMRWQECDPTISPVESVSMDSWSAERLRAEARLCRELSSGQQR